MDKTSKERDIKQEKKLNAETNEIGGERQKVAILRVFINSK